MVKLDKGRLTPTTPTDEIKPNAIDLSEDTSNAIERRDDGLYVPRSVNTYDLIDKTQFAGSHQDWANALLSGIFATDVYSNNTKIPGVRTWIGETTTVNQNITFYPTTTNTIDGDAIFSKILFVNGIVWHSDAATINSTHLVGGESISEDNKVVKLLSVKGGVSVLGGVGLQAGETGKRAFCIIFGIAK